MVLLQNYQYVVRNKILLHQKRESVNKCEIIYLINHLHAIANDFYTNSTQEAVSKIISLTAYVIFNDNVCRVLLFWLIFLH